MKKNIRMSFLLSLFATLFVFSCPAFSSYKKSCTQYIECSKQNELVSVVVNHTAGKEVQNHIICCNEGGVDDIQLYVAKADATNPCKMYLESVSSGRLYSSSQCTLPNSSACPSAMDWFSASCDGAQGDTGLACRSSKYADNDCISFTTNYDRSNPSHPTMAVNVTINTSEAEPSSTSDAVGFAAGDYLAAGTFAATLLAF